MFTSTHVAAIRGNHFLNGVFGYFRHRLSVLESFGYGPALTTTRYRSLVRTDAYSPASAATTFVDRGAGATARGQLNWSTQELEAFRILFRIDMDKYTMQELDAELRQNPATEGLTAWDMKSMDETYQQLLGLQRQIFYGTTAGAKGFLGLKQLCDFASANNLSLTETAQDTDYEKSVINAGGSTSSTASSIYAVKFGLNDVNLRLGGPALDDRGVAAGITSFLNVPTPKEVERSADSGVTTFTVWTADVSGYAALSINGSSETRANRPVPQYSVRRAANVTRDSGCGATDSLLGKLVDSFPETTPDVIYMSMRSGEQWRDSRDSSSSVTIFTPGGSGERNTVQVRSGVPSDFNGIPVVLTSAIRNNDAIES